MSESEAMRAKLREAEEQRVGLETEIRRLQRMTASPHPPPPPSNGKSAVQCDCGGAKWACGYARFWMTKHAEGGLRMRSVAAGKKRSPASAVQFVCVSTLAMCGDCIVVCAWLRQGTSIPHSTRARLPVPVHVYDR